MSTTEVFRLGVYNCFKTSNSALTFSIDFDDIKVKYIHSVAWNKFGYIIINLLRKTAVILLKKHV